MIGKNSYYFCKEDVSLIENYDKAINDTTQIWDCHHRLEIELNMSRAELVKANLYVNRPASELIFLTHGEHIKLHCTGCTLSIEHRKNISKVTKGKNNPMYGKRAWNKGMNKEEMEIYKAKKGSK